MSPSSNWLGHDPLKVKIPGSIPGGDARAEECRCKPGHPDQKDLGCSLDSESVGYDLLAQLVERLRDMQKAVSSNLTGITKKYVSKGDRLTGRQTLKHSPYASVAQLVEWLLHKEKVGGSIPFAGTIFRQDVAQSGSASPWTRKGRWFKSNHPDHCKYNWFEYNVGGH